MALSDSVLGKLMLVEFQAQMLKFSPDATPQPFQESFCSSMGKGFIAAVKAASATAVVPSGPAAGTGIGIQMDPEICRIAAETKLMSFFGSKGDATSYMLNAIYKPCAIHFGQAASVIPASGFGGQAGPIEISSEIITNLIIASLPPDTKSSLLSSQFGSFFIQGIAEGFSAGLKAATPGIVPSGGGPSGLLVAKFE